MSTPLQSAAEVATGRLIEVLSAKLTTELTANSAGDAFDYGDVLIGSYPASSFYVLQDSSYLEAANVENQSTAIFIWPSSPIAMDPLVSGSSISRGGVAKTIYMIAVEFLFLPFEPWTMHGKTITSAEVMVWRAQRYAGSVAGVIAKYAAKADEILEAEVLSMDSTIVPDPDSEFPGVAVAMVEVEVTQYVAIPQQTYSI